MKAIRKHFLKNYEIEIKISLILLVAFLVSLNFISAYLLGRARLVQQNSYNDKVDIAANYVKREIEQNYYKLPDAAFLNEVCTFTGIDQIAISDSAGTPLIEADIASGHIRPTSDNPARKMVMRDDKGRRVYQIIVMGLNREGTGLRRLALFDTIFRILGLAAGLIVAILFFKSVMNPYQKIMKEAGQLDIPLAGLDKSDSVEYAVRIFQEVIHQLKQKETILQTMYDNSEKRADSLARYNEYILGSISTGVIICDNQGIITRFNNSAKKIMGYENQAMPGQHYSDVFGKKHQISKILGDALNNHTYSRREFEIEREDGQRLWVGLSSSIISDNADNRVGAAVLLTDLTRIKKLQEIASYSEKMAALGEMSAGLAHELRNSVAAIIGFGKLLKKAQFSGEAASGIIDSIITESLETEEMLSRFLNFARPLNALPTIVDLSQVIQDSVNWTADIRQNSNIEIAIEDNLKGLKIMADPLLLKNAFTNLIINACQAMQSEGKLNIRIGYRAIDDRVEVELADTGKGIDPQNLPKIFNPFFTTKEKGTGLGLAIVKKIITAHGGLIEVSSKLNEGTTFIISLPREAQTMQSPENRIDNDLSVALTGETAY